MRYKLKVVSWTVVREPGQPAVNDLSNPQAVALLAQDLAREHDDDTEHFWILILDVQNKLKCVHEVSHGSQSASIVHPREVFRAAILGGAAGLVLVHNHPSGDPTPSQDDRQLTRRLSEGARLLGLTIHDHVIIGNGTGRWVSLAEQGLF